ncbi:MFS transporter [Spirillospora sp. NPDC048819]|uniref:MFS transporter n=1 Tax=Spirillospora sp. NPDC048819 TaxID=3155268 RepID=UPI0033C70429
MIPGKRAAPRLPFAVYALTLAVFVVGTDKDLIVGVLPGIARELDVSVATAGQLATVFAVTYAIGAPVLAALTADMDRRRLLVSAIVVFAVANVASAAAPGYAFLLGSRVAAALGAALYTPAAMATAAAVAPAGTTGRALGVVTAGFSAAAILGVPAGALLASAAGWRTAFVMIAVLAVLAGAALSGGLRDVPGTEAAGLGDRIRVLRDAPVLRVLGVSALVQCAGFTVLLYLGPLLAATAGVTGPQLATVLIVFGAAGLLGTTAAGRWSDRFGAERVLGVALAWLLVSLLVFGMVARNLIGVHVAVGVWAVAAWMVSVPQQARLLRAAPGAATVAISLNSSAMYLGSAFAGGLGGAVLAGWDAEALPLVAAGLTAVAAVVFAIDTLMTRAPGVRSPPRTGPDPGRAGDRAR